MRLGIYTDYTYRRDADGASGERAFVRFMVALEGEVEQVERLVLIGRVRPEPGRSHYAIPPGVEVAALPWYESLAHPRAVFVSLFGACARFWRLLDDLDVVWLLGPYLHAILFAGLARLRGRRVVLGVRQDLPAYARARHPRRRWMHAAADGLEAVFRAMARRLPVVVVGPELARNYAGAGQLLEINVSLVSRRELVDPDAALARPVGVPATVLSVGRLEQEKNPLLLVHVAAGLRAAGLPVRLAIVGEGPLRADVEACAARLGVADLVDLLGYVPIDGGLMDRYREADAFLHVSLTEGMPQVLLEAFAAGTPVVATDVGGVRAAAGSAAILIPPQDAEAAVAALRAVLEDPGRRAQLVRAGHASVLSHTLEAEVARLAAFLRGPAN